LATDLTVPFGILQRFELLVAFSSPLVLVCALLIGYWIAGRALAPVAAITAEARSISAEDLSRRVSVSGSRDELQDLAQTLNGMLSRIEDAFRHVSQFTANASHELRTPVALMRSTAEVALLKPSGNADSYREALHKILAEAEMTSTLVDDMLRLARADSGTERLRLAPVNLADNVREACERIGLLAQEKGVHLQVSTVEDHPPIVSGDNHHLLRLWLILLDNAIKYTPSGHVVEVKAFRDGLGLCICEVRDAGIGIAEGDLPDVFERFFRADKARARRAEGAGLGLSIAKWIANAHGARIEVESAIGVGSVFRVVFSELTAASSGSREAAGASVVSTGEFSATHVQPAAKR
jgi:signal transduction histidine kinase